MKNKFLIYIPHFIVFFRIVLVFVIISLFFLHALIYKVIGLFLLVFIAVLDWLDGYFARKLNISSKVGGLLDTMGDRITENTLLVFFTYKQLIPLFVPIIFISRSFMSDFIRYQVYENNIDTFSVNTSKLGFIFVASKTSRAMYLAVKIIIFLLGGIILSLENFIIIHKVNLADLLLNLRILIYWGAIFLVLFSLLRFILLIYDSRIILKKAFISIGNGNA